MSSLLVVVKSHALVPTVYPTKSRDRHWGNRRVWGCQSRVGGHCTRELLRAAAVGSIATDRQCIGSEVAAEVTHNSDSQ